MNTFKEIPVVIAFDENVVIQAKVCILSLLISSDSNEYYHIVCLHQSLSERSINQFSRFLSKFKNCSFEYIDM